MFELNLMAIHPVVKTTNVNLMVELQEMSGHHQVIRIHCVETMNVRTKYCTNRC